MKWLPEPSGRLGLTTLRSRAGQALVTFWVLLGLMWLLPGPTRRLLSGATRDQATTEARPGAAVGGAATSGAPAPLLASAVRALEQPATPVEPMEDPSGSLERFHLALSRTATRQRGATTRVLHYGDSLIDLDRITGPLRRRLQRRYGDAGHGFVLAGKPWRWYRQQGVKVTTGDGWEPLRLVGGRSWGGQLGLGCAAFQSSGAPTWVRFTLEPGAAAPRLELSYMQIPGGGVVRLRAGGQVGPWVRTTGRTAARFHRQTLASAPRSVTIDVRGRVRLLGLTLERDGPGITWENLPLVSARFHHLALLAADHWAEQLRHHRADLVVFQFGANDTISYGGDLDHYGRRVQLTLTRLRRALPAAGCLVIGPLDRLQRGANGQLQSPPVIGRVKARQRHVALASGCAFWDGQRAMGGAGSMSSWVSLGLAQKDLVHLTPAGSEALAALLDRALEQAFRRSRHYPGDTLRPRRPAAPATPTKASDALQ